MNLPRLLIQPRNWLPAFGFSMLWLVNLLPYAIKLRLGRGFGRLLYFVALERRHIASVNISLCFPQMAKPDQRLLVKRIFQNFGTGLIELAMGWWSNPKSIHAMTRYEGTQYLDDALAGKRGVILIGAHFSSLDLAAKLLNRHWSAHAVYRKQKNPLVNELLQRGRSASLVSLLDNRDARQIIKTIKAGNIVWFAPDHDMGIKNSVFAPFFAQDAATLTATQKFVKLTGAPALFYANHRNPDDSGYTVRLSPMPDGFADTDEVTSAATVNRVIADHIMIDTAQYYWFHRKFKTQKNKPKAELYT